MHSDICSLSHLHPLGECQDVCALGTMARRTHSSTHTPACVTDARIRGVRGNTEVFSATNAKYRKISKKKNNSAEDN